jgi:hypothetical protein
MEMEIGSGAKLQRERGAMRVARAGDVEAWRGLDDMAGRRV